MDASLTDSLQLTPAQAQAVAHQHGPLLVVAGPGSGKTRVITQRIGRLIANGVSPYEILAITFTNKASQEMAERVAAIVPGSRVWVSTFHRFCARLLREHGTGIGLKSQFSIYDTNDQAALMRQVLRDNDIDPVHYPPGRVLARISNAKNDLITPEAMALAFDDGVGSDWDAITAAAYPAYQNALLQANAVDFDDLLLHVVTLLSENPELRADLDARYQYVLVDEYQDTNLAQYQIVRAISRDVPNLCATGDPDQSIYGWRGARIANIMQFERDYPSATVVNLEHNFRSTPSILAVADNLIAHNKQRKPKQLLTDNADGPPVELLLCNDGRNEADLIADQIKRLHDADEITWSDVAIFYRVNALSRELESALRRQRIPYQVAAGVAFYDRAEVKDVLAYLQLLHNEADTVAFRRVVNTPPRGIGITSQNRLQRYANLNNCTLMDAARKAEEVPGLNKRAVNAVRKFAHLIDDSARIAFSGVALQIEYILQQSSYRSLYGGDSEDDTQRLANVDELLSAARVYDIKNPDDGSLEGFLEETSLMSDSDTVDDFAGSVTLMTMHAAKGLEFPVVFIVAVEQNILPHERSLQDNDVQQLEEERRLLFVGITRAMRRLTLTHTVQREFRGRRLMTIRSQFLQELAIEPAAQSGREDLPQSWFDEFPDDEYSQVEPDEVTKTSASKTEEKEPWDPGYEDSPKTVKPQQETPTPPSIPGLVTGADLLGGKKGSRPETTLGFDVGQQVRHPHYGVGTVTLLGGSGRLKTATVEFTNPALLKKFVIAKAPLQPVGKG